MKVFITWSGERSRQLAEILRDWLPGVIQAVTPYFSPDDVAKGSRWSTEVAKNLEESSVGLLCLTSGNLSAPWVLFEAGALSKNLDKSKVTPLLFGVEPTDIKGPLVQFQSARFNRNEIKRVVKTINTELGDGALPTTVLDSVFQMWWPRLEEKVRAVLSESDQSEAGSPRTERDMLEEILALTRTQSRRGEPRIGPKLAMHLTRSLSGLVESSKEVGVASKLKQSIVEVIEVTSRLIARGDQEMFPPITKELEAIQRALESAAAEEEQELLDDNGIPF